MSIKKIFIALVAFTCMFANSISQNTFAMKRCRCYTEASNIVEDSQSKEHTEEPDVVEIPRKRVCTNESHQSKDEGDLALAQKNFEGLTREEIKEKLLSGYVELGKKCDRLILTCFYKRFESLKINV